MKVDLPYNFDWRDYQIPLAHAFYDNVLADNAPKDAIKRFYYIWHRRCGKDLAALNLTVQASMARKGTYWHMLPKKEQVRKAIWNGMTRDGREFLSYFPDEIVKNRNITEMKVELINGSIWYALGSDMFDNLLGTNPIGVVMSEYAYSDPRAWTKIEPILMENGGWAIFETTPQGENHAYDRWESAKASKRWWTQMLTIEDTGIITEEQIEELREDGSDEEIIQQEYYCSFQGSIHGAYFAKQLRQAKEHERITKVLYNKAYPVYTFWDLGKSDYTTCWFVQFIGNTIQLVDYFQASGNEVDDDIEQLESRPYRYAQHILPHDAKHDRKGRRGSATTLLGMYKEAKPKAEWIVLPVTPNKNTSIAKARTLMNRCYFDMDKCHEGLNALKSYTKKYDEQRKMFLNSPLHNWASHGADAFMTLTDWYSEEQLIEPHLEDELFKETPKSIQNLLMGKSSSGFDRV